MVKYNCRETPHFSAYFYIKMFEDLNDSKIVVWCMKNRIKPDPELIECIKLKHYLDHLKDKGDILFYSKLAQETWTKSRKQLIKNKATGIFPGVSDYVIIIKAERLKSSNQVLFLEMKRKNEKSKKGVLSPSQKNFLSLIQGSDTLGEVCYGYQEAKKWLNFIIKKLNLKE